MLKMTKEMNKGLFKKKKKTLDGNHLSLTIYCHVIIIQWKGHLLYCELMVKLASLH